MLLRLKYNLARWWATLKVSQYNSARWRATLKVRANRTAQKLPDLFQQLPICYWIILTVLLIGQMMGLLIKVIEAIPNLLMMVLIVALLAGIALWVNDVTIQSLKDLVSQDVIKVIFDSAESIAVTSAVILYFKEAPDRKDQKHYEATQVLDIAAAGRVPTSYARLIALQDLNKDGFDLRGLDVLGADLVGIQLPKVKLMGADLQQTNLEGANLLKANLSKANLSKSSLLGANLQEATLREANLSRSDMRGVNLEKANLAQSTLKEAKLVGANLRTANLYQTNLEEANLWGANLWGANLEEANLLNANLEKASLLGTNLQEVQWRNARLCQTTLPDGTISNRDCFNVS